MDAGPGDHADRAAVPRDVHAARHLVLTAPAGGVASTVGALADAELLLALPAASYPATVIVSRQVGANAAVAFRGNSYSVPPGLAGTQVQCRHRIGTAMVEICSAAGAQLAVHL